MSIALQNAQITKAELAKRLQCDEKEVRRLLDPRHPSKLPRIEAALATVGHRLIVSLQSAA
jgi:antitoxin HicB